MRPDFNIIHHGEGMAVGLADRLISLRVNDEAGIVCDSFELALDNRDNAIVIPASGDVVSIEMGWSGQALYEMGQYTVDEIEVSGLPRCLRLGGKSADMKASLKSGKKREWTATTIGQIVTHIATEHALVPRCAEPFESIAIDHLEQVYESDLHLLTRLAGQYGAVMKPAGGALLFVPRGEGCTSSGDPLPTMLITPEDTLGNSAWRTAITERQHYACVAAHLRAVRKATQQYVYAGSGEPIMYLRHPFRSERDALAAARAKLRQLRRGRTSLSLNLNGNGALCAEMPLELSGFDALTDGEWIVTQAEHTLDSSGFTTRVEAQRRADFEVETTGGPA